MNNEFDIAIVGMSCRLPGAQSLDEFWRNLAGGIESITRFSNREILQSGVPASYLSNPTYVKAAPILEQPGGFDAGFFGFSPMEAKTMDPQHRLLLELAYEALEHAGYDPDRWQGRVGVFSGTALNTYFTNVGLNRRLAEEYIPTLIGNDKDFLSTRISYKLNLKGPSITVQTACSTSMVAVHLARQSLLSEEIDMALAGAVSVRVPHRAGYFCDGGGVVSPDGHVRAFDAKANGTVFGSGGGILVLKRLADALADGDAIHAVIKGSAVNNDGAAKAGYTAPSVDSQADAVVEALANAGVEEAPEPAASTDARPPHVLLLSAKTRTALDLATQRLREFLIGNDCVNLSDVAHTLRIGRKAFPHRRGLVCVDRADAITALGQEDSKRVVTGRTSEPRRPVILLLPGIGDHYPGMAHDVYEGWPVFRQEVDRCARLLEPHLEIDIRNILYPPGQRWKKAGKSKGIDLKEMLGRTTAAAEDQDARTLNQTLFAQPALFTIEYAMTRLWQSLGITPDAIVGHSMGEYVAACLAGVLSLEDAVRLIASRARLVHALPQGAMLAVTLPEQELLPLLTEELSISLINGPCLCVVAGPAAAIREFERMLNAKSIICRPVQNAHAFHSRMLDPIVQAFEEEVGKVRLGEPTIPYISNVTGTWITRREATTPSYWATHGTRTARFSDALHELWQFKNPILLEAGPGRTLGVLAMQHPDRRDGGDPVVVSSIRHHYENQSDVEFLWHGIARLWLSGAELTWDNVPSGGQRRRVALPTYPFERQAHWLEPLRVAPDAPPTDVTVHKNPNRSEWLYVRSEERRVG